MKHSCYFSDDTIALVEDGRIMRFSADGQKILKSALLPGSEHVLEITPGPERDRVYVSTNRKIYAYDRFLHFLGTCDVDSRHVTPLPGGRFVLVDRTVWDAEGNGQAWICPLKESFAAPGSGKGGYERVCVRADGREIYGQSLRVYIYRIIYDYEPPAAPVGEKKPSFREMMELHAANKQLRQTRREHAYQDGVTEKINRNPGEKRLH